jgi:hypothetical protein
VNKTLTIGLLALMLSACGGKDDGATVSSGADASTAVVATQNVSDEAAKKADLELDAMKKSLPINMGPLSLTVIERTGHTINYTYKFNDAKVKSDAFDMNAAKGELKNQCPAMMTLLKEGFEAHYTYEFIDGGKQELTVTKADCESK